MSGSLRYGINRPISIAWPTEADRQRNIELEKVNYFLFFFKVILSLFLD